MAPRDVGRKIVLLDQNSARPDAEANDISACCPLSNEYCLVGLVFIDMKYTGTAIWWIRRDIRITDNQALDAALRCAREIIPVFIADANLWHSPPIAQKRMAFLLDGLRQLDADLKSRDSLLVYRHGKPLDVLEELLRETGAEYIFAEEDYSPYARKRDRAVSSHLPLKLTPGLTLHHPASLVKQDGSPYTVFTPFSKTWMSRPFPQLLDVLSRPAHISTPQGIRTQKIPETIAPNRVEDFPSGEAQALRRLRDFIDGDQPPIHHYSETRNRSDLNGTSGLSPYLRFGMLSARQVVVSALASIDAAPDWKSRRSAEMWLNEIVWREFYQAIIYHFPHVMQTGFRPEFRNISWVEDPEGLDAWKQGKTGYPLIDAAMRQLAQTGWMHNRNRMVVASFLVKNLLIDWREGERWFMQHLIDGDPAANNGGWQWTAGVGTDAAPYFRVFNPIRQSMKFDPHGTYIRRWLPELQRVPSDYIHEPWKMPKSIQNAIGCLIGVNYPTPIIELERSRIRALDIYRQAKTQSKVQKMIPE